MTYLCESLSGGVSRYGRDIDRPTPRREDEVPPNKDGVSDAQADHRKLHKVLKSEVGAGEEDTYREKPPEFSPLQHNPPTRDREGRGRLIFFSKKITKMSLCFVRGRHTSSSVVKTTSATYKNTLSSIV